MLITEEEFLPRREMKTVHKSETNFDRNSIQAVIYWKTERELDIYTRNSGVLTVKGAEVDALLTQFRVQRIPIEIVE